MKVTAEIKQRVAELAKEYDLTMLIVFGSQASGKTHKESDVDVGYLSGKALDFMEQARLNTELMEIFSNDHIDLVNLRHASPLLLKQATKTALVLYERERHTFDELYIYAFKLYEESKPLFKLREHFLNKSLEKYRHAMDDSFSKKK